MKSDTHLKLGLGLQMIQIHGTISKYRTIIYQTSTSNYSLMKENYLLEYDKN